jgi:hypothetical protein
MPIDASIPLNKDAPQLTTSLNKFLNIRQQSLNLSKSAATYNADVEKAKAESARSVTDANSAQWKFDADQRQKAIDLMTPLTTSQEFAKADLPTKQKMVDSVYEQMLDAGLPANKSTVWTSHLHGAIAANPEGSQDYLKRMILGGMSAPQQAATIQPSGVQTNTGQVTSVVNTNPFAGIPQGEAIPGTTKQQVLPPTATTMQGNTPTYVGTAPNQKGPVQSGPAIGQVTTGETNPRLAAADWEATNQAAKNSGNLIGVLQNTKILARKAITGTQSDKLSLANGLLAVLGFQGAKDLKTATDMLEKESNMAALSNQFGGTDLARQMVTATLPNSHMTPEAIEYAADRNISQLKLMQIKQKHMSQYVNNPDKYMEEAGKFNQIDPRALQWPTMSKEEKAAVTKDLAKDPASANKFRSSIQFLQSNGYNQ